MEIFELVDLEDCPKCRGIGVLEEELGSGYYIQCTECTAHTAEIEFEADTHEKRLEAAQIAAYLWNNGKVTTLSPGE